MMFSYTYNVFSSYSYYYLLTPIPTPVGLSLSPSSLSFTFMSDFVNLRVSLVLFTEACTMPSSAITDCLYRHPQGRVELFEILP